MNDAQVTVLRIDLDAPGWQTPGRIGVLDDDERRRAARFFDGKHRRRWRAGRIALRCAIAMRTGATPAAVRFDYGRHGKPALVDNPRLNFNLAHTQNRALLALTGAAPVGIDIEAVRDLDDLDRVARRVFTDVELESLMAVDGDERVARFFCGWTRKEAVLKARGTGLATPLKAFEVSLDGPARVVGARDNWQAASRYALMDLDAETGFAAAVALQHEGPVDVAPIARLDPD